MSKDGVFIVYTYQQNFGAVNQYQFLFGADGILDDISVEELGSEVGNYTKLYRK